MSTKSSLSTPSPILSRSDTLIHLSLVYSSEFQKALHRFMDNADDFVIFSTSDLGQILALISLMKDHISKNHEIIEGEGSMSSEFPTSKEQQAQAKVTAEELRVELDAARLLNVDTISMSYDTIKNLSELLIGLRQRIHDQDTEINQLRNRVSGPKGNQYQKPVYHAPKRGLFI